MKNQARLFLLTLSLAAFASTAAFADDLPIFKQGQWHYDRSVSMGAGAQPMVMQLDKCSDPTAEFKATNAKIASVCKFTPVAKSGNVYTFTADCTTGGKTVSKTELTPAGEEAYSLKVTTEAGGQTVTEELKAKRTGDCK